TWGANFSAEQAADFLKSCYEENLKIFDTADIYGDYTTESLLGEALHKSGINRHEVKIITKCGICLPGNTYQAKGYNTTKKHILNSVDNSLKQLKTNYIDMLLIHRPDPLMDFEEVEIAFTELKLSGKVKTFGVSNFSTYAFNLMNRRLPMETNQIQFSLTSPDALFNDLLIQARHYNKKTQIWSPLGDFFLKKNERNDRINTVLSKLTEKYNASPSQLLLAWILKVPSKITPILGSTKIERIREQKKSFAIKLTTDDWYLMLEASRNKEVD
ncbi:MAG: aldo/keto reductase, partial [Flavobacteriaceae bacterium]|nr:aldo/keto reductase [Flavobacteriaceae bacterium]